MAKANIAVMVSGGGTNLQALIDAQNSGILHSGQISLVISNIPDAYALERAKKAGIDTAVVLKKECGSQAAFEEKLLAAAGEMAGQPDDIYGAFADADITFVYLSNLLIIQL